MRGIRKRFWQMFTGSGGAATIMALNYVQGPSNEISTDNALVRWDATTGRLVQNSGVTLSDAGAMVFPVAGSLQVPNTTGANAEGVLASWVANEFVVAVSAAGGGTGRHLKLQTPGPGGNTNIFQLDGDQQTARFSGAAASVYLVRAGTNTSAIRIAGAVTTSQTQACVQLGNVNNLTATGNTQVGAEVAVTINQSSTAGYKGFRVNLTETTTGSGQKDLLSLEIAATQRARIGQNGNLYSSMQVAIPAGGAALTGLFVSSTAGFGVYYGSGAPTVSAAKGSLYLRSDGSGTGDRMYVNTDGGTTWTAVTTAA